MIYENIIDGEVVFVDREDQPIVKAFAWKIWKTPRSYVVTNVFGHTLSLHRFLMGDPPGMMVDHINGNGLDNRRKNLRVVTQQENVVNSMGWKKDKRKHPCPYKGVWRISRFTSGMRGKPYESKIMVEGKQKYLGCFRSMEEAAISYDNAARIHLPRTAYLNFPKEGER